MLLQYNAFLLKQAIRNPLYLINPPIVTQDSIALPRFSVLHYLDIEQNNHFPIKDLYYFNSIPKNKKIPIMSISDLLTKEEVSTQENKMVVSEIRKWQQTNLKDFRYINLKETPNADSNLISVINYNLLKDLYKYKTSSVSLYYKFYNLNYTYWNTVKSILPIDKDSFHFTSMDIPNNIPNFNLINVILKFSISKYSRVISDQKLLRIIDLYKWLIDDTRSLSSMKDISDEDSKRIIIELRYKGHSSFLPLSVLRSMSKDSKIESTVKIPNSKLQRLFILMLTKIQDKVNTVIENDIDVSDIKEETPEDIAKALQEENIDDDDVTESGSKPELLKVSNIIEQPKIQINSLNDLDKDLEVIGFDGILDKEIIKFETDSEETDKIYETSILKVNSESEIREEAVPVFVSHSEEQIEQMLSDKTPDNDFHSFIEESLKFKTLTSSEIRSLKKINEGRKQLKSPYRKDLLLDDSKVLFPTDLDITEEEMSVSIDNIVVDDNLKKDPIKKLDTKYIEKVIKKDIVACVSNLEKSKLIIKDYTVEENRTSLGNYEVHKLTLKPFKGKESVIYSRIPIIDSEGEFVAAGVKYIMRKQETDLPIRKISATKVALTSNYGKLFVSRTEKKANDSYNYIAEYLRESYINEVNSVTKIVPGGRNLNHFKLPNIYSYLSSQFTEIHTDSLTLLLDYNNQTNYIKEEVKKDIDSKNLVFCGYLTNNKHILVVDNNEIFYDYTAGMKSLGTVVDIFNLDQTKLPKPYSVVKILGDNIPLGICLSYYLGLNELISVTGSSATLLESNKQYKPNSDEIVLKFLDYKLIIKSKNKESTLLFNGFLFYKDFIKQHSIKEFSYKNIYLNLLEFRDSNLIHLKELTNLQDLFLDPITVDVLRSINEPTDFLKLLLRANNLLKDFSYPDINDPNFSRIRGYDRVPGLMYKALTESIRDYRFKNGNKGKIELDPYKVWNYITQDSTVKITEDINPVLDVKESETVTLTGLDGLDKDATPKLLRRYHKNDIGLISEATTDSSDVGLNNYLSPYAKIKNIRGLIDTENDESAKNKSKVFSTSTMLAPMSEYDDPKRINFVSIQNSHTIAADGYKQPIIRTGFEYVMPYKVGKLYCVVAKDDGKVIAKTNKLLTVEYKTGKVESYPLGDRYGKMEGSIYPHHLVTDLDVNSKFKKDGYLTYNKNFFEKDWLDETKLVMKFGRNVTVALTMNDEVYEDSSAISSELSKEMSSSFIKEKNFIIDFKKNIINIVPEGTKVDPNTVLFTVIDENTDYNNLSESSITMLSNLANLAPKAKINGLVDRYEVKYNGDINDMSPTLKKLVNRLDRISQEETKGTEYETKDNSASSEYRSEGKNLQVDTLELKVFIRVEVSLAVGDKGVFANQMKSVVSEVFSSTITTISGLTVNAMFSFKGILNRIVNSPILMGTTNRLVKHVSKQIADIYFK